jgi:plastocyanin
MSIQAADFLPQGLTLLQRCPILKAYLRLLGEAFMKFRHCVFLFVFVGLAGCGDEEKKSLPRSPGAGHLDPVVPGTTIPKAFVIQVNCDEVSAGHEITIRDRHLSVEQLRVNTGDIVRWTNLDAESHSVTHGGVDTAEADRLFSSGMLEEGESVCYQFNHYGSFPYYCEEHFEDSSGGEIVVKKP